MVSAISRFRVGELMTDKCEPSGMCSRATESGRTCERGRCIAFVRGEIGLVWRPPFPRLYAAWGTIWVLSIELVA